MASPHRPCRSRDNGSSLSTEISTVPTSALWRCEVLALLPGEHPGERNPGISGVKRLGGVGLVLRNWEHQEYLGLGCVEVRSVLGHSPVVDIGGPLSPLESQGATPSRSQNL